MGYFGERMGKIARAFGIDVVQVDFEPGTAIDPRGRLPTARPSPISTPYS